MLCLKNLRRSLRRAIVTISIVGMMLGLSLNTQAANKYTVTGIKVKDGDTFVCSIDLGFGVALINQTIRCSDYDAWESSTKRKTITYATDELAKGLLAKKELIDYLNQAKVIEITDGGKDVYGRLLAVVYVDGKLLREHMKEKGALRNASK